MEKSKQDYFQEQNSWFYCIGDIEQKITSQSSYANPQFDTDIIQQKNRQTFNSYQSIPESNDIFTQQKSQKFQDFKRQSNKIQLEEESFTQNSSSNQIKSKISDNKQQYDREDKSHLGKQHIYSKNYRQRKKQHVKLLEQQNQFLKNKIQDLSFRLRELQLQINRLKFMPQQKQFTIDQLNQEFITKVTVIMEKNKQNPTQYKSVYQPSDPFYNQFMQTYAQHGFAGSKKTQIMNYYYNQILEAMLRDSERYFFLMCVHSQNSQSIKSFPEYQAINLKFNDILQPDEDKMRRLKYFQVNLYPMVIELVNSCKQFNLKYKNLMKSMQKIHEFMRINYPNNFDFARMRIVELESWFQKHKYTKMMRNLRCQWLQQIKKQVIQIGVEKKNMNGNKKKKLVHKQG